MNVFCRTFPSASSWCRQSQIYAACQLTTSHLSGKIMSKAGDKRPNLLEGKVSPPPGKRRQISTTTQKTVANFFTPSSQKLPDPIKWREVNGSLLVGRFSDFSPKQIHSADGAKIKVAAFDFDSTIIAPLSGNKFARDANDWKWWHPSVPGILRSLRDKGYVLAIVSNQGGINLNHNPKLPKAHTKRLHDFKSKAAAVLTQLDIPTIGIYAATANDVHRKPRPGMWREFLSDSDLEHDDIDLEESLFVGDAGGRTAEGKLKKDFSCSDRNFAANIGLKYLTPEEFFLNEEPRVFLRVFDPINYVAKDAIKNGTVSVELFSKTDSLDIVLFCGSPGCGKSTFYWKYLQPLEYERVNQDLLKSRDRCLKIASEYITDKKVSVAVDNTNADPETRAHWVHLAKKLNVPIRCVLFTAPSEVCEHNDVVRALNHEEMNPEKRNILPKVAFAGFATRYQPPKLEEGFQDIVTVNFQFEGTAEQRQIWSHYWV
ncbi:putative DNA 3'-phosphatase Tpp1 [Eremomyces bilateralis CBS 781.70]|uniref:DNA 3'-phosphatase Tpp1 n=1 Tax=Eremomyces bilateralis CBS 781.70 TaxID=1392243 RepID=A0A6G1FX62_9PEZI|nr:putative DNA 3'-phosphatase Tpp1 [Eremomyces bilateralis CBS 781.70]KAF1810281.1 putative DNA 3'-phosphatase Tpp1 [Eremomyces bilateralis CBS 781.70]